MRISLTRSLADARQSLLRFPLVLVAALIAGILASIMVSHHRHEETYLPWMMTFALAMPLLLSLELMAASLGRRWLWLAAGVVLLALYRLLLPDPLNETTAIRFGILLAGAHFLVAVAPFPGAADSRAVWQFNRILLLRFLVSAIFTHILFAGLALAMAALDQLLGVEWHNEAYIQLYFLLAFVFNTWFFLGGVPQDIKGLAEVDEYPRPLKILAQHILSTLVVVYLAILMAYLAKVVTTGVWPSGWIGWLVSGVAMAGLLSVVLLAPLRDKERSRWVWLYFLLFHLLMIPAAVMLAMALGKRIGQYGWTEPRYILVGLTVWLLVVLVRYLATRSVSLRFIPATLVLMALLMALGPWSAGSISRRSQMGRLESRLSGLGLWAEGGLVASTGTVLEDDHQELRLEMAHLFDSYGPGVLDSWLDAEVREELDLTGKPGFGPASGWNRADRLIKELGWQVERPVTDPGFARRHLALTSGRMEAAPIGDHRFLLSVDLQSRVVAPFTWGDGEGTLSMGDEGTTLVLGRPDWPDVVIPLLELLEPLHSTASDNPDVQHHAVKDMVFDHQGEGVAVRILVHEVRFRPPGEGLGVERLKGILLLK